MAKDPCTITAAMKAYADKQVGKAINATQQSGATQKLQALAAQSHASVKAAFDVQVPVPANTKHNPRAYIVHFLQSGLSPEQAWANVKLYFPDTKFSYVKKVMAEIYKAGKIISAAAPTPPVDPKEKLLQFLSEPITAADGATLTQLQHNALQGELNAIIADMQAAGFSAEDAFGILKAGLGSATGEDLLAGMMAAYPGDDPLKIMAGHFQPPKPGLTKRGTLVHFFKQGATIGEATTLTQANGFSDVKPSYAKQVLKELEKAGTVVYAKLPGTPAPPKAVLQAPTGATPADTAALKVENGLGKGLESMSAPEAFKAAAQYNVPLQDIAQALIEAEFTDYEVYQAWAGQVGGWDKWAMQQSGFYPGTTDITQIEDFVKYAFQTDLVTEQQIVKFLAEQGIAEASIAQAVADIGGFPLAQTTQWAQQAWMQIQQAASTQKFANLPVASGPALAQPDLGAITHPWEAGVKHNKRAWIAHYLAQNVQTYDIYLQVVKEFPELSYGYVTKIQSEMVAAGQLEYKVGLNQELVGGSKANKASPAFGKPAVKLAPVAPGGVAPPPAAAAVAPKKAAPSPAGPPLAVSTQPTAEDLAMADKVLAKQVGAQAGTNPGGFYEGTDGVKRYVKFYADETQAFGERITNKIYQDMGHFAPDSVVFRTADGRLAVASPILANSGTLAQMGLTPARAAEILDGFVTDVLTANWDAVGTGLDNVVVLKNGAIARIDQGGSLLFRAKAGRKPIDVLNQITEWEKFFASNPYYKQVAEAAGVTSATDMVDRVLKQLKDLEQFVARVHAQGGWATYVEQLTPGMVAKDKAAVVKMLNSRAQLLLAKKQELLDAIQFQKGLADIIAKQQATGLYFQEAPDLKTATTIAKKLKDAVVLPPTGVGKPYTVLSHVPAQIKSLGDEFALSWYKQTYPQLTDAQLAKLNLGGYSTEAAVKAALADVKSGAIKPLLPISGHEMDAAAKAALDQANAALTQNLSASQLDYVRKYSGSSYGSYNDAARKVLAGGAASQAVQHLDAAMRKVQAGVNVVTWRGIKQPHPLYTMSHEELLRSVGSIFPESGYGSTSTSRSTARAFASHSSSSGANRLLRIRVKSSDHAIWVPGVGGYHDGERELLLARNTKYRVLGVTRNQGDVVIDVEIVSQDF